MSLIAVSTPRPCTVWLTRVPTFGGRRMLSPTSPCACSKVAASAASAAASAAGGDLPTSMAMSIAATMLSFSHRAKSACEGGTTPTST